MSVVVYFWLCLQCRHSTLLEESYLAVKVGTGQEAFCFTAFTLLRAYYDCNSKELLGECTSFLWGAQ